MVAYNYKFNNLSAALLFSQFQNVDYIYNKKKQLFNLYSELFSKHNDKVSIQYIEPNTIHSYWMFGIKFINGYNNYNKIDKYFIDKNIEIRPFFYNYKNHPYLNDIKSLSYKNFDNQIILLPLHCYLKNEDIRYIVDSVINYE